MKAIKVILSVGLVLGLSACETLPVDDAFDQDSRMSVIPTNHGLMNYGNDGLMSHGLSLSPRAYLDDGANPGMDKMLAGFDRTP